MELFPGAVRGVKNAFMRAPWAYVMFGMRAAEFAAISICRRFRLNMCPGPYRSWRECWDCLRCVAILAGINFSRSGPSCESAPGLALLRTTRPPEIHLRGFADHYTGTGIPRAATLTSQLWVLPSDFPLEAPIVKQCHLI